MVDEGYGPQGRSIAFNRNRPNEVYWWTQAHSKTLVRNQDYGATWKPFGWGGMFKRTAALAVSHDGQGIAAGKDEYGLVVSTDGGHSFTSHTYKPGDTFRDLLVGGGAVSQRFSGLSYHPSDSERLAGIAGVGGKIVLSDDGGLTWRKTAIIDPDATHRGEGTMPPDHVFWHPQQPEIIYAGNLRSDDGGETWTTLDYRVLTISQRNGDVLLGRPGRFELALSTDRGQSWTAIPNIPGENLPGTNQTRSPVVGNPRFSDGAGFFSPSNAAIDPASLPADPVNPAELRILVPGRKGVYEYIVPRAGATAQWSVSANGLEPHQFMSAEEPTYFLGDILFDPRPGHENTAYTMGAFNYGFKSGWAMLGKSSVPFLPGLPKRPIYRSLDGGRTWSSLHGSEFGNLPDYIYYSVATISADGTLYLDTYHGIWEFSKRSYCVSGDQRSIREKGAVMHTNNRVTKHSN